MVETTESYQRAAQLGFYALRVICERENWKRDDGADSFTEGSAEYQILHLIIMYAKSLNLIKYYQLGDYCGYTRVEP